MTPRGAAPCASPRRAARGLLVAAACAACVLLHAPNGEAFASPFSAEWSQARHPSAGSPQFAGGRRDLTSSLGRSQLLKQAAEAAEAAPTPAPAPAPAEEEEASYSLANQAALFLTYFGLQSGMSFYMKWVLSKVEVVKGLVGVPASFLVTTTQQLVSFGVFILFLLVSRLIGRPYKPKVLQNKSQFLLVLALSLSFTLNIGLNLLSLSLVPLSLTMIIRGCSPLSTALTSTFIMKKKTGLAPAEWACMFAGVLCASAVVVAQSGGMSGQASFAFFFGVAISCGSLLAASLDFIFKGILGTDVKLNALDTICYMALPVAVLTSMFGAVVAKPVPATWAARFAPTMTDFQVFGKLFELNPSAFGWVVLSGLVASVYNIFVTFMVVKLSPTTTAFAGNFNKAATILVSLFLLEGRLPHGVRGYVILAAIAGNIASFTLFNILKKRRQSNK